jgi:hypothetical protein
MAFKNRLQLDLFYTDPGFRESFAKLFSLKLFIRDCLIKDDFAAPQGFVEAIKLTPYADDLLKHLKNTEGKVSEADIKLAFFIRFSHQDLYINTDLTSPDDILQIIHEEIVNSNIRYPWTYDRCLYDRFFDIFPTTTEKLSFEETVKLLEDTPQGVFQLHDFIVGPLGIIRSLEPRFLPPRLSAPLWHCSDPSCNALHTVRLSTGKPLFARIGILIDNIARKIYGPPSEWGGFYSDCVGKPDYYNDANATVLPDLVANAFSDQEIRAISINLLKKKSKEIRQRIPSTKRLQNLFSDSAEKIVSRLSKSQCFQIILITSDNDIVSAIEDLIDEQIIYIPSTETRYITFLPRMGSWLDVNWQCSRLGVRSISRRNDISISRLSRLIKETYGDQNKEKLIWKLRHIEGESIQEKLNKYLHIQDPKQIINDLILSSQENLENAFKILNYGKFNIPTSREDEELLVNKILWKLGFNVASYPSFHETFWKRHAKLLEVARTYTEYNENDKEQIRSAGANFFVSLEEILDYSLSFITWALFSDHFRTTSFTCEFDEARRMMASVLRDSATELGNSVEPIVFNAEGVNTLYPLVQGFRILANLCKNIATGDRTKYERPINEYPTYENRTALQNFPYRHNILLLDIKDEDRTKIIQTLEEITTSLDRAKISNVRNRMQHKRKDTEFPIQSEIETACSALSEVVAKMEKSGICPVIYLYSGKLVDQYKRSTINLTDYRGRELSFYDPPHYVTLSLPSLYRPLIVVPWMHLRDTSETVRFAFKENSDFVAMWRGFPKRKLRIPNTEPLAQENSEEII